jgi:glycerate kinase
MTTPSLSVRVVLAPDKFKGSMTAGEVAEALKVGVSRQIPDAIIHMHPVADGGDGLVIAPRPYGFQPHRVKVTDALGQPITAELGLGYGIAVIEMASASGLQALGRRRDPLGATSIGTGELLCAALDLQIHKAVVGIGGSATTDGGAGVLTALGAKLFDRHGYELPGRPDALTRVDRIDLSGLRSDIQSLEITIACDVDAPLLGSMGAARAFAPQKGASPAQVELLEEGLRNWADVVERTTGRLGRDIPGAGAGGGVPFALNTVLGATISSGIDVFLSLTGFDSWLADADLIITGEGSLDGQSLMGKAPVGVARSARRHQVPVVAVNGTCSLTSDDCRKAGFLAVYSVTDFEPNRKDAMHRAQHFVTQLGSLVAEAHLGGRAKDQRTDREG